MTYAQARLIIWNPDSYTFVQIRAAVTLILSSLTVSHEDLDRALALA